MCGFLAGTLLSHKAEVAVVTVSLMIVALAAYLFSSGIVNYPVDANKYVVDPTSWASFLMAAAILPFIVFQSITLFQRSTIGLLSEINNQKIEIERLATHDHLTGLPLLSLAEDRLQMAINSASRSGKKVALLFIDLDGFKTVNDTFGHEAGDQLLKEISRRLLEVLRTVDTAARIGGDEFAVVIPDIESNQVSAAVAERIIEALSSPVSFSGATASVGASIGIALFPDHAADSISLRRAADEAMYSVKRSGKNGFSFPVQSAGI